MNIQSSTKTYEVRMEKDFSFVQKLKEEENALFAIDRKVYELYQELFLDIPKDRLFFLDALEENKRVETALDLCEIMTSIPAKRNAHLVSVGGGIIQDITGFAANILYRGIKWTFIPTTLLAACDSCIGGKTSLNYKKYKNLLGTFYPPDRIYICSQFFHTLQEGDFKSGLGEVVKFNIMYGEDGLKKIEKSMPLLLEREQSVLDEAVYHSLSFKKSFIEKDEFDRGERIKLNFAHTFGHAFETSSNYQIPHGTAVAMGMIIADRISMSRGYFSADIAERIEDVLLQIIPASININGLCIDSFVDAIHKDKKQVDSNITAILLNNKMELGIYHDIEQQEIEDAMAALKQQMGQMK